MYNPKKAKEMKKITLFLMAMALSWGAMAQGANELVLTVKNGTDPTKIRVGVELKNEDPVAALELYIGIPDGASFNNVTDAKVAAAKLSSRVQSTSVNEDGDIEVTSTHNLVQFFTASDSKSLYLSMASPDLLYFTGKSGEVCYLTFDGSALADGEYEVDFHKSMILFSKSDVIKDLTGTVKFKKEGDKITSTTDNSAVDDFSADALNGKVNIYDLLGRAVRLNVEADHCLEGLRPGVYMVNGKKIVVENE